MEFDEYEYLEKTVEDIEPEKLKEKVNDNENTVKSDDREGRRKHKHDGNSNDISNCSKQAKSGDEKIDRDRERGDRDRKRGDRGRKRGDSERDHDDHDKERSERDRKNRSSHHRSSSRDVVRSERGKNKSRHEDREREERNGKVRDRDQRRERGLVKEKDHKQEKRVREGEKDPEKDKESGRERSHRTRRHSERHKGEPDKEKHQVRERTFEREKSRDRELRVKETDKEIKEPDPDNRIHIEKKEEVADPEVDLPDPEVDPERDQRTVFAYQICLKADERDVYEFFSRAGKVRDVRLIMDRKSKRSRGVGYIEFYNAMAVPMAIALSGQTLLSHPVMVKPSEAEKNLVQSTTSAAGGAGGGIGPYSGGARRLYVGNLHHDIKEDQLRQVFESFGSVELVQLPLDQETGHCKGYGFVQFARLEDARAAESLNGQLEIAGRAIKVSAVTDQAGMQDIGAIPGDFDNDEGGSLSLNAQSRAILMQKLDRSGTTSSFTGIMGNPDVNSLGLSQPVPAIHGTAPAVSTLSNPLVQAPVPPLSMFPTAGLPVPSIVVPSFAIVGVPSECLLLKNMFDPNSESEPDFDLDIKEDVQDECSRYGTLKHIFVDKNTSGFVYLRFDSTQAATSAQRALHGRWFAGKMITATFMVPQNYESRFPVAD